MLKDTHGTDDAVQHTILREIDSVLLNDEGGSGYSLDDPLLTAGLNSLLLAQLLLQLETELGVDPFAGDRSITDVRTVRELIAVYEESIQTTGAGV
ncbi:phosphopantetheine-binding protein [Streptomyces sp. AC602_WCS936]|uniref:phosphopantetheine-binding protein n=1 Tax=Streptomyces sp. AC602_WCS936 TaxID=2823685 RepID=UPI001C26C618|nr:phosphopantetheine-binding protein [Streptomyces sp. AC602_WCS936]